MGQGNSRPLTPGDATRLREYSVYIALLLAVSRNRSRSQTVQVDALSPEQIVTMVQKQTDFRVEQETHRLQRQAAMLASSSPGEESPNKQPPLAGEHAGSTSSVSLDMSA